MQLNAWELAALFPPVLLKWRNLVDITVVIYMHEKYNVWCVSVWTGGSGKQADWQNFQKACLVNYVLPKRAP